MLKDKTVVLGITGGIAAYKAADIASKLTQAGARVEVVMTESATRFIAPLTLRNLTGRQVITDMFEPASEWSVQHISLAEAADVVVIAPATADIIARMAHGIADDMLSCMVLATLAPVIIAPSMNDNMYQNSVTQGNLYLLKRRGFTVIEPEAGRLASGKTGKGRLPDTETIIGAVKQVLGRKGDLAGRKIVVTAGGTQEPIDPVRHITNRSSGKMGYALAEAARDRGAEVTLISAPTALPQPGGVTFVPARTAAQMKEAVSAAVQNADALVMAAAVADYQPRETAPAKIKKDSPTLTLRLVKTPDIITEVKGSFIKVGFAAESENTVDNARKKLAKKGLDLIVANDITATDSGFEVDTNKVVLIDKQGKEEPLPLLSKREVAEKVLDRVVGLIKPQVEAGQASVEIPVKDYFLKYKRIQIPAKYFKALRLESGSGMEFITGAGTIATRVEKHGGEIWKGMGVWFRQNPRLKAGDIIRITAIEPAKKYRLELLK